MYNREEFDREYFEQGPMTGKSLYTNYRWLPELTLTNVSSLDYLFWYNG